MEFYDRPEVFVYPTRAVAVTVLVVLAELLVVCWWLFRERPALWLRSIVATMVLAPVAIAVLPMAVDSAPWFGAHALWVSLLTFYIAAVSVCAGVVALARRIRHRESTAEGSTDRG